jgi:hypothetical protein
MFIGEAIPRIDLGRELIYNEFTWFEEPTEDTKVGSRRCPDVQGSTF